MNIYGIIIGIAVVIGIELIRKRSKYFNVKDTLLILISTVLGARILFLLHNIEEIRNGTIHILNIWDGGLAFFGGLIGILLSTFLISKYKDIKYFKLTDVILLFLPLIQSIGRLGNYFNYELFGKPTDLIWGIYIPSQYRVSQYLQYSYFHPVFAYESILNIFNFLLLIYISKRYSTDGLITGIYLISYSLIRLGMNILRIDKEYFLGFETSDLLSLLFLSIGGVIVITVLTSKKF